MLNRQENQPENESDSDNVCLPCFADRSYTSTCSHATVLTFFVLTGSSVVSSALLLLLSQITHDESLANYSIYTGVVAGFSAVSTGLSFFCGTRKNSPETNETYHFAPMI